MLYIYIYTENLELLCNELCVSHIHEALGLKLCTANIFFSLGDIVKIFLNIMYTVHLF